MRPHARPVVPIGAAFGLAIGGGRFAVCRVIGADRQDPANMLVAATRWIGTRAQLPRALRDPRTKKIVAITHHNQFGKPYVVSVWNRPPRSFISLGELLPSAAEQKLKRSYFEWATLKDQYRAQLDWDADADAVKAADKKAWDKQKAAELAAAAAEKRARSRVKPRGRAPSLAQLGRKRPFADWRTPERTRGRTRIAALIALLADAPRDAKRDLAAIVRCARVFNKERDLGTLEAEELHDALVESAWACGILPDDAADAIDAARDW